MNGNILIASSTISEDEYGPVVYKLTEKGYNVTVYNSDRVVNGTDSFLVNLTDDGNVRTEYNGEDISSQNIHAMWYRKVADFQKPENIHEKATALLLQDEIACFHQDIWVSLYEADRWLNAPANIIRASNKLGQLIVAKNIGFDIPETLVGSNWGAIHDRLFIDKMYKDIIVKMVRGVIIQNGQDMALPTTKLSEDEVSMLKDTTTAFPGIYQPFKQKFREWRVTVVGQDAFPVAIYTDEEAKSDWRRHQTSSHVYFKPEKLDDKTISNCVRFLGEYGLRFGAFDFIEDSDGRITFLECNANGQYFIFEQRFGLPISDTIVGELINIAQTAR